MHSDIDQMHGNTQRLRDLIEYKERQAHDAESKEKQAIVINHQLQTDLKMAKDEIKKLSSMVIHRESRFSHEAKKRDQEISKLKERLIKVMNDTKQGSTQCANVSIEFIGDMVDKPDGKSRARWRNNAEDQKRGDELLQRAIDSYQDREDSLVNEVMNLKNTLSMMIADICEKTGHAIGKIATELPENNQAIQDHWKVIIGKINSSPETDMKQNDSNQTELTKLLAEHFTLGSFVPLSEVKHTAPPEWVSRAQCTLPPTGKAENVKLRDSGSDQRQRPRSSHLSPYRGMQATASQNQAMYKSVKSNSRCGSMSPTSASPTRYKITKLPFESLPSPHPAGCRGVCIFFLLARPRPPPRYLHFLFVI